MALKTATVGVYTKPSLNGHLIQIMFEECRLPYAGHPMNIGSGDPCEPELLKISLNNKILAIPDPDDPDGPDGKPSSLFESDVFLVDLAGKTGKFLPTTDRALRRAAMADVPAGHRRPDAWLGPPLTFVLAGEGCLFDRALQQRSQAAVRRQRLPACED